MTETKIDTSFQTMQRDLFSSGMVAQIGVSAFGVWQAIKAHADFNTGESESGMRRIAEMTGMGKSNVLKCVKILEEAKLLRVVAKGKRGSLYIARERMDVRLGDRVLCTIVLDYVPSKLRHTLAEVSDALSTGRKSPEAFADCEIIPGEGFHWDSGTNALRASIPATDIPKLDLFGELPESSEIPLVQKVLEMRKRKKSTGEGVA